MADPAACAYDRAGGEYHVFLSLYVPQPDGGAVRPRILYEAGLWTQLRRAPQEVSSLGCTWGVYVEGADGVHAAQLLRAWSSPVSGAYRVHPNGFLEKAQL